MIVDSSALIAIFYREPGYEELYKKLKAAPLRFISAGTLVEAHIVVGRRSGEGASSRLKLMLEALVIDVVDFTEAQAELAREAFLRFGKGRHPAKLNMGDCFSYALAKDFDQPLLFMGEDFGQTDVLVVG